MPPSSVSKSNYTGIVPAVDQAMKLLFCLGKSSTYKMNLTDICDKIGIHKSKGHNILNTLKQYEVITKDEKSKTYSLGSGLVYLARNVLDNLDWKDVAQPCLKSLSESTGYTALFCKKEKNQVYVVGKDEGSQEIGLTIRIGHRYHITHGAHGKVLVAFMGEAERRQILDNEPLLFNGGNQTVDRQQLEKEFSLCRKQGFAVDIGGMNQGMNAVSSPVFDPAGEIIGCILLLGTFSKHLLSSLGNKTCQTSRNISEKLGADFDSIVNKLRKSS